MNKNIIVIDTETTGLDFTSDVLQVSIIDFEGNILFDSYLKPIHVTEWKKAERVHGISPEILKDLPTINYYKGKIQEIIDDADLIIGYNLDYDIGILKDKGINFDNKDTFDVMLYFAEIYGEWNEYYGDYKWQKLTTCARYYGYTWEEDAHNSLGDVKATLYCYKKIIGTETTRFELDKRSNNLKLSDKAIAVLKALPSKYTYIAKNNDGDVDNLHIFIDHPHLISSADENDNNVEYWQYWHLPGMCYGVASLSLFSFLFEDLDPNICYKISDLIGDEDESNCYDCNIVEAFRETMLLVLELLNNDEAEKAKEVICDFLGEKE